MATIRQIATRAGVSPATVSRVINNDPRVSPRIREEVLSVANQSRYVPRMGRRSTENIGFVYTSNSSLGSPYDAALMAGMGERMEERGLDLMILDAVRAKMSGESFTQLFMRKGMRGVVLRTTDRSHNIVQQIADEGFPAVVVGDRFESASVNFITCDSRGSSREAVAHLIELGHKRVGVVTNVVDDADHSDRLEGYYDALKQAGIEIDPRLVFRTPARVDGGVQVMRRIRTMSEPPTALFVADPMTSIGAMNEARRMGVEIPRELSIVGFDDSDVRFNVYPTMTAVCQNTREIGREAFELLSRVIDRAPGEAPMLKRLTTNFEVHGSSGACSIV